MNSLKNRFFLVFLLYSFSVHSFELTENQQLAVKNMGMYSLTIGALGLGSYLAWTYNIPESFYVKNSYPYAQVWYDEMAVKYPQAHFDQRRFLSARRGLLDNAVTWEAAYNDIYAPAGDLERIHEIYQKKNDNIEITETDKLILCMCEFLLLHEAAHIENQDSFGRLGMVCASGMIMEFAAALYRSTDLYNPLIYTDFLGSENHLDTFCSRFMCLMAVIAYIRYTESRADQFAYDNAASFEVLYAGKKLFENLDIIAAAAQDENSDDYEFAEYIIANPSLRWIIDFLIDRDHPGLSVRAQNVQNEINRRLQTIEQQV